jgi:hypothetical protein
VQVSPEYSRSSTWQRLASSGTAWTKFRMSFGRASGNTAAVSLARATTGLLPPGRMDPGAARTRWRSLASRVALADHQLVVAGGRIVLSGKHQPVVGGEDDLGGGAHGAALGEVAADGAALVVGDGQVQVAAVV